MCVPSVTSPECQYNLKGKTYEPKSHMTDTTVGLIFSSPFSYSLGILPGGICAGCSNSKYQDVLFGGLKESVPSFTAESAVQATPDRPMPKSKRTAKRLMSFRVAMTSVTSLYRFENAFTKLISSSYDCLISAELSNLSLNGLQHFFHFFSRRRSLCGRNTQDDHLEEHSELVRGQAEIDH